MFKWGVLSTAKIAREQLLPAIAESENGVVHGIASRNLDRARVLADQVGAPMAYGSYQELLDDPDIDGVYIPLPNPDHIPWSIRAAQAGKHVLVEKPVAMKADDIAPLIAARDKAGVIVAEAYMVHYHPQWHAVRDLIAADEIGELRMVQGAFTYYNMDANNTRNQADLGGGGLPDIGVYPTVTTRIATGKEPIRIRSEVQISEEFGTDTFANATIQFDGFTLSFYCSTQMALHQSMVFHGTKGKITLTAPFNANLYDAAKVQVYRDDTETTEEILFRGVNQYKLQVEAFVEAAQGGGNRVFTLENSVHNQRVIDAIYSSNLEDDWVVV